MVAFSKDRSSVHRGSMSGMALHSPCLFPALSALPFVIFRELGTVFRQLFTISPPLGWITCPVM
jgi:hypothetical protein